jgi:hypothetical protein
VRRNPVSFDVPMFQWSVAALFAVAYITVAEDTQIEMLEIMLKD